MISDIQLRDVLVPALHQEIEMELSKINIHELVARALNNAIVKICNRIVINVERRTEDMGVRVTLHIPIEEKKE